MALERQDHQEAPHTQEEKVKELMIVETISIRCECEHFVDKYEPSDTESCLFSIVPVYDLKLLALHSL